MSAFDSKLERKSKSSKAFKIICGDISLLLYIEAYISEEKHL
jgi:hypothetical protein